MMKYLVRKFIRRAIINAWFKADHRDSQWLLETIWEEARNAEKESNDSTIYDAIMWAMEESSKKSLKQLAKD